MEQVSRVNKIVSNVPTKNKTSLIITDQRRNERLEALGEYLRDAFDRAILETYRTKISRRTDDIFLRERYNVGSVNVLKVDRVIIERMKQREDGVGGGIPSRFVEGRPKPIRVGAGRGLHRKNGRLDFSLSEGLIKDG
jgi:hypothetical protein